MLNNISKKGKALIFIGLDILVLCIVISILFSLFYPKPIITVNTDKNKIAITTQGKSYATPMKNYTEIAKIIKALEPKKPNVLEKFIDDATNGNRQYSSKSNALQSESSQSPASDSALTDQSSGAGTDFSQTNTQVKDVDEADIVKTDGKYIYYLSNSTTDGKTYYPTIYITQLLDGGKMKLSSKIIFKDSKANVTELYIKDNKLVAVGMGIAQYGGDVGIAGSAKRSSMSPAVDMMYGYNMWSGETYVLVYDITNREKPTLDREIKLNGGYNSSRLIGNKLYMITGKYVNTAIDDAKTITDYIPAVSDKNGSGKYEPVPANCIVISPNSTERNFVTITTLDIINPVSEIKSASCFGSAAIVYANTKNVYLTSPLYSNINNVYKSKTSIIKFSIENNDVKYLAGGEVDGYSINQFALDEYNDYLRIATTTEKMENGIYVLDKNLKITGSVTGLAPGERIYSVRFNGASGYVVTYKNTDPLFAIDLSDPAKPKVLGQLKIPGFSQYMHPYSDDLIIGVGMDTEDKGQFAVQKGVKISLFDVSNPLSPKEISKYIIGDKGSNTPLSYNHKAFLFSKEKNIIAFPVTVRKDLDLTNPDIWNRNSNMVFDGMYIMGINADKTLFFRGSVTQAEGQDENYVSNNGLNVIRGLYAKDVIYTFSQGKIQSNSLADYSVLDTLKLDFVPYNNVAYDKNYSTEPSKGSIEPSMSTQPSKGIAPDIAID